MNPFKVEITLTDEFGHTSYTHVQVSEPFIREWYSDYRYEVSPLTSNQQLESFVDVEELYELVRELISQDFLSEYQEWEITNLSSLSTYVKDILEEMRRTNKKEFFEGLFDKHTPVEYVGDDDKYIYYRAKKDDYRP